MKVLSLFDGISCGRIALERAMINVEEYHAFEIDKYAISISKKNYPDIIQHGDVLTADFNMFSECDLLIGGSPCQDLCSCGSRKGLDGEKSGLFFEYLRALETVKPKYFLLENNNSMSAENKDIITEFMGVEPIMINSDNFSAQTRRRLYWTNIPIKGYTDKKLFLKDIVQPTHEKTKYEITERMKAKKPGTLAYDNAFKHVRTLNEKMRCLLTSQSISNTGATNIIQEGRYYKPTPIECERAQTLPDNYTEGISDTQRYKCIGNGWTVDVIAHIFKGVQEV